MRQLLLIFIALPLHRSVYSSKVNVTANEKARYLISRLVDDYRSAILPKKRTKRQMAKLTPSLPMAESLWQHSPDNPLFYKLLDEMNRIIPGKIAEPSKNWASSDPKSSFLVHVQEMIAQIKKGGLTDQKIDTSLAEIEGLANDMKKSGTDQISQILKQLSDLYTYLETNDYYKQKPVDPFTLAPFTKLGYDCFSDVNHKEISWEVRKAALSFAKYIEDRMLGDSDSQKILYKTDAILSQIISLMAQLHRATLRNWHHTLMLVSNFAYIQETGISDLMNDDDTGNYYTTREFINLDT